MFCRIGFLIVLACTACNIQRPAEPCDERRRPVVLVSIAPYRLFVQKIGGHVLDVRSIVPSGVDVHTFEPTPRQQATLEYARIWFRIGEPFEGRLIEQFGTRWHICDLREGIELLNGEDRHIWLSPRTVEQQLPYIVRALCEEFPEHRTIFENNALLVIQELKQLDREISVLLQGKRRSFLVSHGAFGYFCRDYQLHQWALEMEGKELRTKQFSTFIEDLDNDPPLMAICLPQHNNKGVQMISDYLHIPMLTIDPYTDHYFEMMHKFSTWVAQ